MKLRNSYFLLRHGETVYQGKLEGRTYPWPDVPPIKLTKKAERKIQSLAKKLKRCQFVTDSKTSHKIDLIYSSDVFRVRQTAEIVANELGLRVRVDKRLRDYNLGVYQDGPKQDFYKDFPIPEERFSRKPAGGECWNDIKKRLLDFLKDVEKKHKNKTILIASHGDTLWLFEGILRNLTDQQLLDEIFKKKDYIKPGELRKI